MMISAAVHNAGTAVRDQLIRSPSPTRVPAARRGPGHGHRGRRRLMLPAIPAPARPTPP